MYTPITLLIYNRPTHTRQTVEALQKNALAKDSDLIIFSDAALLENAGYKVRLLEWFDEQGKFHHEDWNVEDGLIRRSTRFDPRNSANPTTYTSLIIDASKP